MLRQELKSQLASSLGTIILAAKGVELGEFRVDKDQFLQISFRISKTERILEKTASFLRSTGLVLVNTQAPADSDDLTGFERLAVFPVDGFEGGDAFKVVS